MRGVVWVGWRCSAGRGGGCAAGPPAAAPVYAGRAGLVRTRLLRRLSAQAFADGIDAFLQSAGCGGEEFAIGLRAEEVAAMEAGGWGISSTLQLSCRFLATAAGCKQQSWREGVAAASSSVGAAPCSCHAATAGVQSRLLLSLRYLTSRLQADVEGVHPLVTNAARRLQLLLRMYAAGVPPRPSAASLPLLLAREVELAAASSSVGARCRTTDLTALRLLACPSTSLVCPLRSFSWRGPSPFRRRAWVRPLPPQVCV